MYDLTLYNFAFLRRRYVSLMANALVRVVNRTRAVQFVP